MRSAETGYRISDLKGDGVSRIAAVVLALAVLPYFLPWLGEGQLRSWSTRYVDLSLYLMAFFAVTVGANRIASPRERRFWRTVALALSAPIAAELVHAIVRPTTMWNPLWDLGAASLFLGFYLGLLLSVEVVRADNDDEGVRRLRWLRSVGLGMLLVGGVIYFQVIPTALLPEQSGSGMVAIFLYAALDVFLCVQFLLARSLTTDRRWRSILGGLVLVSTLWAIVDLAEALYILGPMARVMISPRWEVLWFLPSAALVVVGRSHLVFPRVGSDPLKGRATAVVRGGPILGYAMALPGLHLMLTAWGALDPVLHDARTALATILLVGIGGLAVAYQRVVERQNEEANHSLSMSRERYQSFIQNSVEGIYRLEFTEGIPLDAPLEKQFELYQELGYVAEANDALARMYGYETGADLVGKTPGEVRGGDRDADSLEVLRQFVLSGFRSLRGEVSERDRHGALRYFEKSAVGGVENGILKRVWGTQVDITERRLATMERERLEGQLRQSQKMETIGTLAGGIAHDFNNVLAPILGYTELAIEQSPPDDSTMRSYLDHVMKGATRAQGMVSQILAVSRNQESRRESMLVQSVVLDALKLIRATVPSTIRIVTKIDESCPAAFADPGQIHQVVMNLGTNACQAIGESAGEIRVEVSQADVRGPAGGPGLSPGKYVVLEVGDDGPGISPEAVDKVFEPFFTTKGVRGGTGLGLSVVHGIVAGHGGDVRLTSTLGEGTRFVVYLPATELPVAPEAAPPIGVAGAVSRVLVVDDEKEVAGITVAMLSNLGFEVTGFVDSMAALEAFRSDPLAYDVILTDHTMPDLTGPELAREARAANPNIAVVIASGYRLAEAPEYDGEFQQLGKPFRKNELAEAVRRALESVGDVAVSG